MDLIKNKTECFERELTFLKKDPLYNAVMSQFNDTFEILKRNIDFFGVPERVENRIDDAIFFTRDKSKCLLIVLQRNNAGMVFGGSRVIKGRRNEGKWSFKVSVDNSFDRDYFEVYKENTFANISILARYNILTDGDISERGCKIDENYWFEELER